MMLTKKRVGKKSHFPLNLNEIPDKSGRLTTDFVRYFLVYIFIFIPGLPFDVPNLLIFPD